MCIKPLKMGSSNDSGLGAAVGGVWVVVRGMFVDYTGTDDVLPGPHYHECFIISLLVHNGNNSTEGSGLVTAHQPADGPGLKRNEERGSAAPR